MAFFTFNTVDKKHWDPKQKSYVGFTLGVSLGSCGRVARVCVWDAYCKNPSSENYTLHEEAVEKMPHDGWGC